MDVNNNKTLRKTATFTDIHFGARSNAEQHNQDCLDYIEWFCSIVKKDPEIDSIVFMGDWFENRSALNVMTLNYSYRGAKMLNDLGLPVFFIIGNHDLYHRHTRALYSTINFAEFNNFQIINEPTVIPNLGQGGSLVCPYLFNDEYPTLVQYRNIPVWWGHFEFQGFVITGYNVVMPTGPSAADFDGPKRIFSGHFHKRQINGNVCYIGNTFPTTFGDAGDNERGCAVYDHETNKLTFHNWDESPKFCKVKLTEVLDGTAVVYNKARVKCLADVPITFEESTFLRTEFLERYQLREFILEETSEINDALRETQTEIDDIEGTLDNTLETVDDLVIQMLRDISSDHIDNNLLVELYTRIQLQC